jgi:hypothetical protein
MTIPNKWNKKSGKEMCVELKLIILIGTCISEPPINAEIRIYSNFNFPEYFLNITFIKMKNKMNVTTAHSIKVIARNGEVIVSTSNAKIAILNKSFISVFILTGKEASLYIHL